MTTTHNHADDLFDLTGRVAVVTGGAGLFGYRYGDILAAAGAHVILVDLAQTNPILQAEQLQSAYGPQCLGLAADITSEASLLEVRDAVVGRFGRMDILINNPGTVPTIEAKLEGEPHQRSRLEDFPLAVWNKDIAVGVTSAFLCSRIFGEEMVKCNAGVILNVACDLSIIPPHERFCFEDEAQKEERVTYSVVQAALVGLTRYLAVYWAAHRIRVNAILPGCVFAQSDEAADSLSPPLARGRIANWDEYRGAILFLCSDASSSITGQNFA